MGTSWVQIGLDALSSVWRKSYWTELMLENLLESGGDGFLNSIPSYNASPKSLLKLHNPVCSSSMNLGGQLPRYPPPSSGHAILPNPEPSPPISKRPGWGLNQQPLNSEATLFQLSHTISRKQLVSENISLYLLNPDPTNTKAKTSNGLHERPWC